MTLDLQKLYAQGTRVIQSSMLPFEDHEHPGTYINGCYDKCSNTLICSPDLYATLKGPPSDPK